MVCLAKRLTTAAVVALALASSASAHPGAHEETAMTETQRVARKLFVQHSKRQLEQCVQSTDGRKLQEKAATRRAAMLQDIQARRRRLDADTALATNHESSLTGLSADTDPSELFGTTPACLLEPKVTEGPYYVKGELLRSDIREEQPGIDLYVDLQFIDVTDCTAVNALYVDFWHANLTGVYSGVIANGNGDSTDASNIDNTFHRGLAPTDEDGFVNFTTKFPGHYTGRATHIHILAHHDGTVLENNTYSGGEVAHVGQIFFDQDLIDDVLATDAYQANTNTLTTNANDNIAAQSAADNFDPYVQYVLLGDTIEEGLLAWISVGVDMTKDYSVSAAVTMTADGGVATSGGTDGGAGTRGNAAVQLDWHLGHFTVLALVLLQLLA